MLGTAAAQNLTPMEELGKDIFFDQNLAISNNQSCASCHDPEAGWTGPDSFINAAGSVYEGSIPGLFGSRKPPSSAYATFSPIFHLFTKNKKEALFTGGNFWDGRATGERLGNPAADQALGPFLNPVEQALPDSACVVYWVCNGASQVSFEKVWRDGACDIDWPSDIEAVCATEGATLALPEADRAKSDMAYGSIGLSIAAYEDPPKVNAFTSKFDYTKDGMAKLSKEERRGFALFQGKGKCKRCHTSRGLKPLFTDFTFDNLGLPRNPENPWYEADFNPDGSSWIDEGLGGFLDSRPEYQEFAKENKGKHKVPTLRNVDKRPDDNFVKAYGHNGYFKSLKGIVHFYNTRDVKPICTNDFTTEKEALASGCWPAPEVAENLNMDELGDLGLSDEEEDAIVELLETLSDGYSF
jgi:cytochrome c peroxidase